ncbi:MAG: GNAT family N-acetyltransferase [Aliiglaciecola sp.]|uniref:GNAT family N-acetyltransferase n=1 Tax=Aliiglaciecola sp. M165 TaxID=2593649 RepID=UPI00117D0F15|nr:GNAT family N-acetyltransferase [Aliiglaciecola sp. M165]TRY33343.1 GNAT family N-acetyltransferase [Aliiglaciecola sp. M165]
MSIDLELRLEQPVSQAVKEILQAHHQEMFKHSPPESVHALDQSQFHAENIRFYSAWQGARLAGCGALKSLDTSHVEIKSMRTAPAFLRQGVAAKILSHLLEQAKKEGYSQISLETGTMDFFKPARLLYKRFGFAECPPFADYFDDPHSVCMTKMLVNTP